MGTLISDTGNESSLKAVCERTGFSGLIFLEQETKESIAIIQRSIPVPFILLILNQAITNCQIVFTLKIAKQCKMNCEETLREFTPD